MSDIGSGIGFLAQRFPRHIHIGSSATFYKRNAATNASQLDHCYASMQAMRAAPGGKPRAVALNPRCLQRSVNGGVTASPEIAREVDRDYGSDQTWGL